MMWAGVAWITLHFGQTRNMPLSLSIFSVPKRALRQVHALEHMAKTALNEEYKRKPGLSGELYENFTECEVNVRCVGLMAAAAECYRYRIVAGFVTSSSPVPLKTRRVGQRCTLNLSRAETSSRWWGVVVRRGGTNSGVVHVT
ncbi:uncharacterized protein TNCV_1250701 [Trichonephila clavipes]|nr:uncharacterized protein TNCV_1250701 [Trichonephila clavipes]